MIDNCNGCQSRIESNPQTAVPYIVHEAVCARHSINMKRLVVALIVSIALMFASNVAWLIATTASGGVEPQATQHEFDNSR